MNTRTVVAVATAVIVRPGLWIVALRQAHRMAGRRWWSRFPFLPVPPAAYMRFRLVTAYGGDGSAEAETVAADVIAYLRWCRGYDAAQGSAH